MKTEIPTEVEMKLEMARQCELSIKRLSALEKVFKQLDGHGTSGSVYIPPELWKLYKDWTESRIIIERTNIHSYGK